MTSTASGIRIKQFELFKPFDQLLHGFSTRRGGLSSGPFRGLNLGLHSGDEAHIVKKNRHIFFTELGIYESDCVFPEQVHSAGVTIIDDPGTVPACDALITSSQNICLTVQTADCFPVFIFDPVQQVVALVHSGWRGTAARIVPKTLRKMSREFKSDPADCLAAIGPGVQQNCYQVDEETAAHFEPKRLKYDGPGHFKLDVQNTILDQLQAAGIGPGNIEVDTTCTHCDCEQYYSYRRDGRLSGRMMAVIGLKAGKKEDR